MIHREPYLNELVYSDATTKTVKIKDCLTSNEIGTQHMLRTDGHYELANVYLTGSKLKHESLILAQDERWRRA